MSSFPKPIARSFASDVSADTQRTIHCSCVKLLAEWSAVFGTVHVGIGLFPGDSPPGLIFRTRDLASIVSQLRGLGGSSSGMAFCCRCGFWVTSERGRQQRAFYRRGNGGPLRDKEPSDTADVDADVDTDTETDADTDVDTDAEPRKM